MPIFELTLQRTYYEKGFFNVTTDFDRFVRSKESPARLGRGGAELSTHLNVTLSTISKVAGRGRYDLYPWRSKADHSPLATTIGEGTIKCQYVTDVPSTFSHSLSALWLYLLNRVRRYSLLVHLWKLPGGTWYDAIRSRCAPCCSWPGSVDG